MTMRVLFAILLLALAGCGSSQPIVIRTETVSMQPPKITTAGVATIPTVTANGPAGDSTYTATVDVPAGKGKVTVTTHKDKPPTVGIDLQPTSVDTQRTDTVSGRIRTVTEHNPTFGQIVEIGLVAIGIACVLALIGWGIGKLKP